jgi:hypothetical protein
VTKFVGKFRKNRNYNDDYNYESARRHRNEHAEIKKLLDRAHEGDHEDDEWIEEEVRNTHQY